MARQFTESTTDALKCSTTAVYNSPGGSAAMTVSFWMYLTSTPAAPEWLLDTDDNDGRTGWFIRVNAGPALELKAPHSGSDLISTTSVTLSLTAWHHVLVTWDGTTSAANALWYVDGVLHSTATADGVGAHDLNVSEIFAIGNANEAVSSSAPVRLAAVGIWSRVLTGAEIALLAGGLRPGGILTGLVADIPINGASPEHDAAANIDFTVTGTSVVADPPALYLPFEDEFWSVPIVQPQEFLVSIW